MTIEENPYDDYNLVDIVYSYVKSTIPKHKGYYHYCYRCKKETPHKATYICDRNTKRAYLSMKCLNCNFSVYIGEKLIGVRKDMCDICGRETA